MTRFPKLVILIFVGVLLSSQAFGQSVFLSDNQGGFSLGIGTIRSGGLWNIAGSAAFNLRGRTDLGLSVGTANIGAGSGTLAVPSLSFLALKDPDGFNWSLDASYAIYQLNGFASSLESSLNGLNLGSTIYQAIPMDDNNSIYPFMSYSYGLSTSIGAIGIGAQFALGHNNKHIYSIGPSAFFASASSAFGLSMTVTFTGRKIPGIRKTP